jgi:nucleoside-diphosphate-sugar epimerase
MIRHLQTSPAPPSRVVVLGASGFVGKELLGHLAAMGVKAIGLSSRDPDLTRPDAVERLGQAVTPADALVFVSALTPDKGKDARTLMRNLSMGEHVAAFLERCGCAHLVYLSSDAVYGDAANPVRETSACAPSSLYGLMQLTREQMLADVVQKSKIPYLVLRPTLLYGAGDTHNAYGPNRFLRTARADGKITLFGNGEEKRDHVHIDDVSRLVGLCLCNRSEGVLNVATGTAHSFYEVAQAVAASCGPAVQIECLARSTPITHRHFDVTATVKAFPSFRYTPLATGLAAVAERKALAA